MPLLSRSFDHSLGKVDDIRLAPHANMNKNKLLESKSEERSDAPNEKVVESPGGEGDCETAVTANIEPILKPFDVSAALAY